MNSPNCMSEKMLANKVATIGPIDGIKLIMKINDAQKNGLLIPIDKNTM